MSFYIAVLLADKPIVGRVLTREVFQKRFAELCQQSEGYLGAHSNEQQKCQKLFGFYYTLSKTAPHIYYAWPAMMMTKALAETFIQGAAVAPERVDITQAKKELLTRAETFFKKIRALQVLLMEYGLEALKAMPEFKVYESLLSATLTLKEIAKERLKVEEADKAWEGAYKAANILPVIETFLSAYAKEVFTVELGEEKLKEAANTLVTRPTAERQGWKKSLSVENGGALVRDAAQHGLIQLPPKKGLKEGLQTLEANAQEVSSAMTTQALVLKQERQAVEAWLDQKEKEYLEQLSQLEGQLQGLSASSAALSAEFQQAYTKIKQEFDKLRQQAAEDCEETKRKIRHGIVRQLAALAAATALAAIISPAISGSLVKSLGIVAQTVNGVVIKSVTQLAIEAAVKGALIGGMTAGFSGDTGNILKNALVSGFLAGFREVAVGALAPTITSEALRTTLVSGLTATIRSSIDGGNVRQAIYMSIGQNLTSSKENPDFLEFVTTQAVNVLVSSGVQSLVTHTDFIENVATMTAATVVQEAAASVGHEIHEQLVAAAAPHVSSRPENYKRLGGQFPGTSAPRPLDLEGGSVSSTPAENSGPQETGVPASVNGRKSTSDEPRPSVKAAPHPASSPENDERIPGQFPGTFVPRPLDLDGSFPPKTAPIDNRPKAGPSKSVSPDTATPRVSEELDLGQRFGRAAHALSSAVSGEAHAETDNHPESFRVYEPESRRFFAGRFLSQEPISSSDFERQSAVRALGELDGTSQSSFGSMAWRALNGDRSPEVIAWQQQNRRQMPLLAQSSDALNRAQEQLRPGTWALGLLQTTGGVAEIGIGTAMASTPLAPLAPVIGGMGIDNVLTGIQTAWTGEHHSTSLYHVVNELGRTTGLYGPQGASYIEMGLNMAPAVNPRALMPLYNASRLGVQQVANNLQLRRYIRGNYSGESWSSLVNTPPLSSGLRQKMTVGQTRNNFNISNAPSPSPGLTNTVKPTPSYDLHKKLTSKSLNDLAKPVDQNLINKLSEKGWKIDIAKPGSDDWRYLTANGSDASFNTGVQKHILLKEGAPKSALLEEFLHGTQNNLGLLEKYGTHQALEVHVKDFMLRHVKLLGLDNPHDIRLLQQLKIEEISRLGSMNK